MIKYCLIAIVIMCPIFSSASDENEKLREVQALMSKYGVNSAMQQFVAHENDQLPISNDRLDTVTSVMYLKSTKAKIYKHVLAPGWEEIVSDMTGMSADGVRRYMADLMQQQSIGSICSNKLNQLYLKHGVRIVNIYSGVDGEELFKTTIKKSDCHEYQSLP